MVTENFKTLICVCILTPFVIFQVTVIIFIVKLRRKKNSFYCSSFFTLFVMVTVIDIVAEIDVFIILRLIAVDFLEFLFIDNEAFIAILYQLSSYTLFSQLYIHLGIAVNRFYMAFTTTKKLASDQTFDKIGKILIWILPFLTIPFILPRFWFNAYTARGVTGQLMPLYNVSSTVRIYITVYSTVLCVGSAVISFILQVLTIIQYRNLLKSHLIHTKKVNQDIRLLLQAMIVLVTQFLMAFQQFSALLTFLQGNMVLNQWFNTNYIYFQNVLNFTGPVTLMIVGKQIRKDYIRFMFGKSKKTHVQIIMSTAKRNSNSILKTA